MQRGTGNILTMNGAICTHVLFKCVCVLLGRVDSFGTSYHLAIEGWVQAFVPLEQVPETTHCAVVSSRVNHHRSSVIRILFCR